MFVFFLVLTVISVLVMIAGVAWWLIATGKPTTRSGPDVGAEIMGASSDDAEGLSINLLDKSAFRGKGVAVSAENEISYGEVKRLVRERRWREVLPPLLGMTGLFCFIVFGALALWLGLQDKLVATLIVGVVLFTMGRIAYNFIRA